MRSILQDSRLLKKTQSSSVLHLQKCFSQGVKESIEAHISLEEFIYREVGEN